ncbi:hypothetical protein C8Q80DRAFT_1268917 [Daedaleopsis nitida]|nr:hypothetical protein C8Q80DRAFT_1268917 [Daedaleopsis nitida]
MARRRHHLISLHNTTVRRLLISSRFNKLTHTHPAWPYYQPHRQSQPPAPAPPQPQPQHPEVPPPQNAVARKPGAKAAKPRPNAEPCPGVFHFPVVVDTGDKKREFSGKTDMPWDDFHDPGKGINLTNTEDFAAAMNRVCDKVNHTRTKPVSIDIKNATKAPAPKKGKGKGKKRAHEDDNLLDTPRADDPESDLQLKAYKRLEPTIRCEAHQGHCFVLRQGGQDKHRCLSHGEMTLWAKKTSLGEATIYDPPRCMNFDHGPAKRPCNSKPPQPPLQVHVTINTVKPSVTSTTSTTPLSSITRKATPIKPSSSMSLSARTDSDVMTPVMTPGHVS